MKLKVFIQKLKRLSTKHGNDADVIMADNIPVVDPVFSSDYPSKKSIVITDEE